ncbi:glycosyltransferase family 4 protein [Parabacteroides sp. Marseille-P3160]|uniref:glycosyltransferase family 4 protein n=1 Tax=Parabacteroides sp. Marseille-P3160 TaxID=1917887 RepID=UPI0009BB751C|nr:glycosyltransferase family 4 protein [Parabacteroides sp. Marseille-P3160]
MEVLFVSHKFPPSTGGMEKQCYELVTGMEKRCKVHRLVYERKENKLLFFLSLQRKIKKICTEHPGIDIIHFNDALIGTFCSFQKQNKRISYVVTLHGLDVVFPSAFYHKYIFKRLNRFSRMIAVSRATAEQAIALGIDPEKIMVVPNGVDVSVSRGETAGTFEQWLTEKQIDLAGKKLLMMLGRPVERKGFSWFAGRVFPKIKENYFLVIAGPFHRKPTMQERLIELLPKSLREKALLFWGCFSDEKNLRGLLVQSLNIRHLGHLSSSELKLLFRNADAFLMPNIHVEGDMEGFGLVCLEASVQGALVFASQIDGIPDAIQDGKNGFLLPPKDASAWTNKLDDFAQNTDAYKQYQSRFSQFTKDNYHWERMVDGYYEAFLKTINDDKFGKSLTFF